MIGSGADMCKKCSDKGKIVDPSSTPSFYHCHIVYYRTLTFAMGMLTTDMHLADGMVTKVS